MISRRALTQGAIALLGSGVIGRSEAVANIGSSIADFSAAMQRIEAASGGRLGVAFLDTSTGDKLGYRTDERFAMCSTFKLLAVAAILSRVDRGEERLDRRIRFQASEVISKSPIITAHVGGEGLSLAELCEAALTLSDNTAANLILASLGGPSGLTGYIRTLGDAVTRLDRNEPALNEAVRGDERDTTTPRAMAENLRKLLLGDTLSKSSKERLTVWLVDCKTGGARLRAGLPKDWRVGDKTGTGEHGTANDVAIGWPMAGSHPIPPLILSVYLTQATVDAAACNAVLASVARAAAATTVF